MLPKLHARLRRPSPALAVALLALFVALGGVVSAHGGDPNQVHACVVPTTGGPSSPNVRIVGENETCPAGSTARDWAIQGPAGPPGPAGGASTIVHYALVSKGGTLIGGSTGVASSKASKNSYQVDLPGDVRKCAKVVTADKNVPATLVKQDPQLATRVVVYSPDQVPPGAIGDIVGGLLGKRGPLENVLGGILGSGRKGGVANVIGGLIGKGGRTPPPTPAAGVRPNFATGFSLIVAC
jgi:hypothetical protein